MGYVTNAEKKWTSSRFKGKTVLTQIDFPNNAYYAIERFHMTLQRPYWCSKTKERQPCWCTKLNPRKLNFILMQIFPFVA